jgi:CHAT domain-containing protein/Tfp pilus assembly protein PilF
MFARLLAALIVAGWSVVAAPAPPRSLPASAAQGPRQSAQQAARQEKPDDVLAKARQVSAEDGPKAALPLLERALAMYRAAGDRRGEAIATGAIGLCYWQLGELDKALDFHTRALAMKREVGDRLEEGKTLSNLGLVYWDKGDYRAAVDHLTRAIAIARDIGDRRLEGAALNNLGLVYDQLGGDYRRSLDQYQRALDLYSGIDFPRGESDTIGNIGGVYLMLGQYREALRYYQRALAISERLKMKPSASQDLGNIAHCYLGLGQIQRAIEHFDRALALARETGMAKEEADWLRGRATALARLGRYNAAFDGYGQALGVYERAKLQRELLEALNDFGALHARLGDFASAERNYRRALGIARAIDDAHGVTVNLVALGDLERRRRRLDEAGALYRDALDRATKAEDQAGAAGIRVALAGVGREQGRLDEAFTEAGRALADARAIDAPAIEAEALVARADVTRTRRQHDAALADAGKAAEIAAALSDPELGWRAGYARGQSLESLGRNDEAAASYRSAAALIEDVRSQLRDERFRASYLEDKYQVYVSLVQLLLKLGRTEEAFTYAEKLRARQYLEWMNRGLPPVRDEGRRQAEFALGERVRQLQRAVDQEHAKPSADRRRQALDLFSAELVDAEREYQAALAALLTDEPAYAAARALASVSSDDVQRRLAADAALVEYVVADDSVAVFVIRSTGIQAKTVPIRSIDLAAKVELLRELIVRESAADWQAPAASLHRTLISPIEEAGWLAGVHHLYLVPHGLLHYVPFAALPRGRESGARLVVNDYVIAYLPAAAALTGGNGSAGPADSAPAAQSVMAMAPARTGLQFTQQEAAAVAALFPRDRLLLVGGRATEAAFKTSAGRYDVLHLATHGYFNRYNPLLSGLDLEAGAREDGRLEVHEILGMRLAARLVVLSACDTALGGGYFAEVPSGDDIVGLTRAFLFAGSPSVVASLWAVNDRSTMGLMGGFYGRLRGPSDTERGPRSRAEAREGEGGGGEDKATALAEAQREMLARGGRYAHPYVWGAFVLVGRM